MTSLEPFPVITKLVSTHMPLARHDHSYHIHYTQCFVSTHMPLARHDVRGFRGVREKFQFLLTCLLRGMTVLSLLFCACCTFLLTCLLRGMTRSGHRRRRRVSFLLTCLLRGMTRHPYSRLRYVAFLLTCLLRGMTNLVKNVMGLFSVSTHMPLARHDKQPKTSAQTQSCFYSHASCEA